MLISIASLFAQNASPVFKQELEAVVDNDYFFFEDYYYTAGLDIYYRRLARPRSFIHRLAGDSAKVIVQYHYGIKIFNPFNIETPDVDELDRPYAGWNFGSAAFTSFRKPSRGNRFELETGIVGPSSGMENLQLWIHKITTYDPPLGWEHQIRNEWVVNGSVTHFEGLRVARGAEVVSQTFIQAGTGSNKISQDVTFRFLKFNTLNNSAYTQSRLGGGPLDEKEFFLFFGAGFDYVVSSIFIEGSLFKNNQSEFTVQAVPWVWRREAGIMYSTRRVSWSATYYHLSKEVPLGTVHDYASLRAAVRF